MRKRDVMVFLLATFLLVIILQQEGSVSFDKGFFYRQYSIPYDRKDTTKTSAKPIVTDIEGNGQKDLVVVSDDGYLRIVKLEVADAIDSFTPLAISVRIYATFG
jgi:hypothetical protein